MARAFVILTLIAFTFFVFIEYTHGSKYSRDVNMKDKWRKQKKEELNKESKWNGKKEDKLKQAFDKQENPFRVYKINLVWQKAKKKLKAGKLGELYVDLKNQDKAELQLKKLRAEGKDEDGKEEANVRQNLLAIMDKYGLSGHGQEEIDNRINENLTTDEKNAYKTEKYMLKMDRKLSKLWERAEMSGFNDEELEDLRKEFLHHQQKLEEFQSLKNEIDAMDGLSDNSIEGLKKPGGDKLEKKEKKKQLKEIHKDLMENYRRLEDRAFTDGMADHEFTEPKVVELWVMAKRANFTDVELTSFKEELKHFEHKVKKHDHFKEQAELVRRERKSGGGFEKDRKMNDNAIPVKHQEVEERAKDYAYKVKKHHTELRMRIAQQMGIPHSEL